MNAIELEALEKVVDYCEENEREDFNEFVEENDEASSHIYFFVKRLRAYLESIKDGHRDREIFIDDDGYICFLDRNGLDAPGLLWTLHHNGWDAYVNDNKNVRRILSTLDYTFPSDDDMATAARYYEIYLEKRG